jgi:hypothetical protein
MAFETMTATGARAAVWKLLRLHHRQKYLKITLTQLIISDPVYLENVWTEQFRL